MRQFSNELKRRKVYRVAVVYLAAAFVVVQLAELAAGAFGLPGWFEPTVWVFCALGFPLALVLAWAFDVTPEGVERTSAAGEEQGYAELASEGPSPSDTAWAGSHVAGTGLVVLGVLAAAIGGWYLLGAGGASERSVAVLPFENMGGEESVQFTRGVHDGLLTRLSNVSDLQVISRTSVMRYQDTEKTVPEIAEELGTAWVVEGAVQQAAGQVQVNAQLIQARQDAHRWARTYQRQLTPENLFAIQSELTKEIARSLKAELTPEETERVEREPTRNLEAYSLYTQGRGRLYERTETGVQQAVQYFRRAIERDSSYARAWSGLADALSLARQYGYDLGTTEVPTAAEAARRALALASTLAEAHTAYGYSVAGDFEAMRGYRRAIELNPSYPQAYYWLAVAEAHLGRLDSAVAHIERAVELDPLATIFRGGLSIAYYQQGRLDEALRELRRAKDLVAALPATGSLWEGWLLSAEGRQEEALAAFERGFGRISEDSRWRSVFAGWEAVPHARMGNRSEAEEIVSGLEGVTARALKRSFTYAALGDLDRAASELGKADPEGWDWLSSGLFRHDSILQPIRDTPEYGAALRELNRSLGLHPDGSVPDSVDLQLGPQTNG